MKGITKKHFERCADIKGALLVRTDRRGPDECWPWIGNRSSGPANPTFKWTGYGRLRFNYELLYAHRETYRAFVGDIPDGFTIDHLCFNGLCQNPKHLQTVPQAENSRRYMEQRHWPNKGKTVLRNEQRVDMRAMYLAGGMTQGQIAKRFGVSNSTVSIAIRKAL